MRAHVRVCVFRWEGSYPIGLFKRVLSCINYMLSDDTAQWATARLRSAKVSHKLRIWVVFLTLPSAFILFLPCASSHSISWLMFNVRMQSMLAPTSTHYRKIKRFAMHTVLAHAGLLNEQTSLRAASHISVWLPCYTVQRCIGHTSAPCCSSSAHAHKMWISCPRAAAVTARGR